MMSFCTTFLNNIQVLNAVSDVNQKVSELVSNKIYNLKHISIPFPDIKIYIQPCFFKLLEFLPGNVLPTQRIRVLPVWVSFFNFCLRLQILTILPMPPFYQRHKLSFYKVLKSSPESKTAVKLRIVRADTPIHTCSFRRCHSFG